jgi:hypothetical protein
MKPQTLALTEPFRRLSAVVAVSALVAATLALLCLSGPQSQSHAQSTPPATTAAPAPAATPAPAPADAPASSTAVTCPSLWRGGDAQPVSWQGGLARIVEFSADSGANWKSLQVTGASPLTITIPAVDTNSAQLRITLDDNSVRTSDAFSVDSTPPRSALTGSPFMSQGRSTAPKGNIVVPFDALGSDVKELFLRLVKSDGTVVTTAPLPQADAMRLGFPAPADDVYDLTLLARDRVGNEEKKDKADAPAFIADTVSPAIDLKLGILKNYAVGGSKIPVQFKVNDANLDPKTVKFEYLAGDVVREAIDFGDINNEGTLDWTLPREDIAALSIRLTAQDKTGNISIKRSDPFTVFSGVPQAVVVGERDAGDVNVRFDIDLLNAGGLSDLREDWRVDIYLANWDRESQRWNWDTANPVKDLVLETENGRRFVIYSSTGKQNSRGFCARLVVGDGNNAITEPVPAAGTEPESMFLGLVVLPRVTLEDPTSGKLQFRSGEPITFNYAIPPGLQRGSELMLEYSRDGGAAWLPITPTPVKVARDEENGKVLWDKPPATLEFAIVRAVTRLKPEGSQVLYRVQDLMSGGIVIDSQPPRAEIIRVTDQNGRPLQPGDYTNSRKLEFEWRATDTGGAGLQSAYLWDNAASVSGLVAEGTWNSKTFMPGTLTPSGEQRPTDFTNPKTTIEFGPLPVPVGRVGFLIEAIDKAGNRKYPLGQPDKSERPAFSLNVDFVPPKVKLTESPGVGEARPGAAFRLTWIATDNDPDPRIPDTLGPNPCSIYVLDDQGNRNLIETGLPASGTLQVQIPQTTGQSVRFLVTARDRAGNVSGSPEAVAAGTETGAMTNSVRVQNASLPEVRLTSCIPDATASTLAFAWDSTRGDKRSLANLTLWLSLNNGGAWTRIAAFGASDPVTFKLPGTDGDFSFSLTAASSENLAEPDPRQQRDVEQTYIVDTAAPELELVLDPQKTLYFAGDEAPRVRVRIRDAHYVASATKITVTRDSAEGQGTGTPPETENLANDQWVEFRLPLREPETILVSAETTDIRGNRTAKSIPLPVKTRPDWEITGLSGEPPYYCRSARDVLWTSRGFGAKEGRVNIYIQAIIRTADGWKPVDNSLQVAASAVKDDGRHAIEGGLPDTEGEFILKIDPLDTAEPVPAIYAAQPFTIVRPTPVPVVEAAADAAKLADGRPVYKVAGAAPLTVAVTHKGTPPDRPYELRIRKLTLKSRHTSIDGKTTDWMERDASAEMKPIADETGRIAVPFPALVGEGAYEVFAVAEDELGFRSDENPASALKLVFDGGAPVATLNVLGSQKSVYTDEDVAKLSFTAQDPLLDPETVTLESCSVGTSEWKAVTARREFTSNNGTQVAGYFHDPELGDAGRYLLRVTARDRVGNIGVGQLNNPVFSGDGKYDAGDYTTNSVSRRASCRIHVQPRRPWEEGLKSLTLWWRYRKSADDPKPSVWRRMDFPMRLNIGEQSGNTVNSLPFTAAETGEYDFIVTSESLWGHREEVTRGKKKAAADATKAGNESASTSPAPDPYTPIRTDKPEMSCWVYCDGFTLTAGPLRSITMPAVVPAAPASAPAGSPAGSHADGAAAPAAPAAATPSEPADTHTPPDPALPKIGGKVDSISVGETYVFDWRIESSTPEAQEAVSFTLETSTDAGHTWTSVGALTPFGAEEADVTKLPAGTYIRESVDKTVNGSAITVRAYRVLWKCPLGTPRGGDGIRFRVTAVEASSTLPEITKTAQTSSYAVK